MSKNTPHSPGSSKINLAELPIFDWALSLKLANNKPDLAVEMFNMLLQELPIAQQEIKTAYSNHENVKLYENIHRLHGACCYCGVPRLKEILFTIEHKLKEQNFEDINELMKVLDTEINAALKIDIHSQMEKKA